MEEILNQFEGVQVFNNDSLSTKYILKLSNNDNLEVYVFKSDKNEVRFIHDNFPGQRRFFNTNIPYTSIEDFEMDLKRMKIELPNKLVTPKL